MFERFTKQARVAVVLAQEEARESGADRVTAAHLLVSVLASLDAPAREALAGLGLTADGVREAASDAVFTPSEEEALRGIGIDLDSIAEAVRERFGADVRRRPGGRRRNGHIPLAAGAKKSLELALRETIRLKGSSIRPEHLLLGILRSDDPEALAAVDRLTTVADVRTRLVELLGDRAA